MTICLLKVNLLLMRMSQLTNHDVLKFITESQKLRKVHWLTLSCVPFYKYIKCHVYPENQGTHYKLNQIREVIETPSKIGSCFGEVSMTSCIWLMLPCVPGFPYKKVQSCRKPGYT